MASSSERTPNVVRLNINVNAETAAILQREKDNGISATETIRRAIGLYDHFRRETAEGRIVLTRDADGNDVRQVLL